MASKQQPAKPSQPSDADRRQKSPSASSSFDIATFHGRRKDAELKNYGALRLCLLDVIEHPMFDGVLSVIIFANMFLVIVEVDARALNEETPFWVRMTMRGMLGIYAVELAMRLFCYRAAFFKNKFFVLDLVTVLADGLSDLGPWSLPSLSSLRLLRVMRLLRLVRLLRQLYFMLHGFVNALRAISWAVIMLALALTVWGVIAVEVLHPRNEQIPDWVYAGCERCPRAYQSVHNSVLTFSQQIIAGDGWGALSVPIMEYYPETTVIFVMALMSLDFVALNLILTVIVDKAAEARDGDTRMLLQEKMEEQEESKRELLEMCERMDGDSSGTLTAAELLTGYDEDEDFAERMRLLDVQREDMTNLFHVLDTDGSGDVQYAEFVDQLWKMKTQDTKMMLVFMKSHLKSILRKVTEDVGLVRDEVNLLARCTVNGELVGDFRQRAMASRDVSRSRLHGLAFSGGLASTGGSVREFDVPDEQSNFGIESSCIDISLHGDSVYGDVMSCPAGHVLKDFGVSGQDWACSVCSRRVPAGSTLHSCRSCDYDVCSGCARDQLQGAANAANAALSQSSFAAAIRPRAKNCGSETSSQWENEISTASTPRRLCAACNMYTAVVCEFCTTGLQQQLHLQRQMNQGAYPPVTQTYSPSRSNLEEVRQRCQKDLQVLTQLVMKDLDAAFDRLLSGEAQPAQSSMDGFEPQKRDPLTRPQDSDDLEMPDLARSESASLTAPAQAFAHADLDQHRSLQFEDPYQDERVNWAPAPLQPPSSEEAEWGTIRPASSGGGHGRRRRGPGAQGARLLAGRQEVPSRTSKFGPRGPGSRPAHTAGLSSGRPKARQPSPDVIGEQRHAADRSRLLVQRYEEYASPAAGTTSTSAGLGQYEYA